MVNSKIFRNSVSGTRDRYQIFTFYYITKCYTNYKLFYIPSPHPLATTNLHFASMDLHILDISHKWNHIIHGFLCLLLSFRVMMSRFIYIVAGINTTFIFGKILFHNMDILHFVYLNISWWPLGFFLPFGYYDQCYSKC